MQKWFTVWAGLLLLLIGGACSIPLHPGLIIRQSTTIRPATYQLPHTHPAPGNYIILIKGTDIEVDFQGATLQGSPDSLPNHQLRSTGILIKNSGNVILKNLTIKGFRTPIRVEETASVYLENVNISHFFQPQKGDTLPDFSGDNPWEKYGTGVFIRKCYQPTLTDVTISSGGIGVWMEESHSGELNHLEFNAMQMSGLAFRNSTQHIIHHNIQKGQPSLPPFSAIFGDWSQQNVFGWNNWGQVRHPWNSTENIFYSNSLITSDSTLIQVQELPATLAPYASESPSDS